MKGGWPFWLMVAGLAVLHFFLHLSLGLGMRAPDLLTVAVLLGARQLPGAGAAALGFFFGLLEDAVAVVAFGAATAVETVVGYLGARSRDLFVGETGLFLGLYLFLGCWLHDALYYLLAEGARQSGAVSSLLVEAPLWSLYSAAAGMIAVMLYRSVRR